MTRKDDDRNDEQRRLRFVAEVRDRRDAPVDATGTTLREVTVYPFRDREGRGENGVRELRATSGTVRTGKAYAERLDAGKVKKKLSELARARAGAGFAADSEFVEWESKCNGEPSLAGLDAVRASGSSQFTANGLHWTLDQLNLERSRVVVVDLRQEPHAFLDAGVVTWIADQDIRDHALLGATREAARDAERELIAGLRGATDSEAWFELAAEIGVSDVFGLQDLYTMLVKIDGMRRSNDTLRKAGLKLRLRQFGATDDTAALRRLENNRSKLAELVLKPGRPIKLYHKPDKAMSKEQKQREKGQWPLWRAEEVFQIHTVQSEEELIGRMRGLQYRRLYVPDHEIPESDQDVDDFVGWVNDRSDAWFHLHCRGGKGRTTTFMCMIDALRTAHVEGLTAFDIVYRQWMIGGSNLDGAREQIVKAAAEALAKHPNDPEDPHGLRRGLDSNYKLRPAFDRATFVRNFVEYARATRGGKTKTWSNWVKGRKGTSLNVAAERMLLTQYEQMP